MNILIFKSTKGFQYEVVNVFADELGEGLRKIGCNVTVIDCFDSEENLLKQTIKLLNHGLDLVINFNGFLVDQNSRLSLIYDILKKLKVPVGIILVDHPFYHYNRIKLADKTNTFICMYDEGFLYSFEEIIDDKFIIGQLMHGASKIKSKVIEKKYDIVVAGSLVKPVDFFEAINKVPEGILKEMALNIFKKAKNEEKQSLDNILKDELRDKGISLEYVFNDDGLKEYLIEIYILIDKNMRYLRRYEAIKELVTSGLNVELFGNCEVDELRSYTNLKVHGPKNYVETLEEISKGKILINVLPCMENASHERILSAMLNETLVLSSYGNFCNGNIKDKKNIIFFDQNNSEDIIEKAKYYLKNDLERKEITDNAKKIATQNTWDERAVQILELFNEFKKFNCLK